MPGSPLPTPSTLLESPEMPAWLRSSCSFRSRSVSPLSSMSMAGLKVLQVDAQVEFVFEHAPAGGADDQVDVAPGGQQHFQQPHRVGHAAGARNGDDNVTFHALPPLFLARI